jgi:hypothetical protein
MTRNLQAEMVEAAQSLSLTGRVAKGAQRKLSKVFTVAFREISQQAKNKQSTQSDRRRAKKSRTEAEKVYRINKARSVYQQALKRGSSYFVVFGLVVTVTDCRDPEVAMFPEQDERPSDFQLSLHDDSLALFRSWGRFNGYARDPAFIGFMEGLLEPVAPEVPDQILTPRSLKSDEKMVVSDFEVVSRIIRDRSLTGNTIVRQAMRIIFPEEGYKTWPLRFGIAPMVETTENCLDNNTQDSIVRGMWSHLKASGM